LLVRVDQHNCILKLVRLEENSEFVPSFRHPLCVVRVHHKDYPVCILVIYRAVILLLNERNIQCRQRGRILSCPPISHTVSWTLRYLISSTLKPMNMSIIVAQYHVPTVGMVWTGPSVSSHFIFVLMLPVSLIFNLYLVVQLHPTREHTKLSSCLHCQARASKYAFLTLTGALRSTPLLLKPSSKNHLEILLPILVTERSLSVPVEAAVWQRQHRFLCFLCLLRFLT